MNKHFTPAISEEKFAAWLDGMLPADEMNQIGSIIEDDPELRECAAISSSIDTEIQNYINDEFLFQTDMEMVENSDFEIPIIETHLIDSSNIAADVKPDNPSISQDKSLENDFPTPIDVPEVDIPPIDIPLVDESVVPEYDSTEIPPQTNLFDDIFSNE